MKKAFSRVLPALFLAVLPAAAHAEGSFDSTTILRIEQEKRPGNETRRYLPLTQFVGADFDKLGDGNLSAHLYGWLQLQLVDSRPRIGSDEDKVDGNLTYGYLQYRFKSANAKVRAGRFFVTEGIVSEQVDGVSARTDLPYGFGVSAFGGATVHAATPPDSRNDGKGDGIFGGRINYRKGGLLEVGLSGIYESPVHDRGAVPAGVPAGSFGSHRRVGGDFWISPHGMVQFSGRASYNTETTKLADQSYLLQVTPMKDLLVSASFDQYNDRDFFYSSIIFSDMLKEQGQQSRAAGASATYSTARYGDVSADFKHYSRNLGKGDRFGGEWRGTFLDKSVRSGVGYHYLRTTPDFAILPSASGSFHEIRAYALHDTKGYFASVDLIDYIFKEPVQGRDYAWEGVAALGYHLTPDLSLSGDLSYGKNPQYDNEVKVLVRLTYNTTNGAKGATK